VQSVEVVGGEEVGDVVTRDQVGEEIVTFIIRDRNVTTVALVGVGLLVVRCGKHAAQAREEQRQQQKRL